MRPGEAGTSPTEMRLVHHVVHNFQVRLGWRCSGLLHTYTIPLSFEVRSDMRMTDKDTQ